MNDKINNQTYDNEIVVRIVSSIKPFGAHIDIEISDRLLAAAVTHLMSKRAFRSYQEGKE